MEILIGALEAFILIAFGILMFTFGYEVAKQRMRQG